LSLSEILSRRLSYFKASVIITIRKMKKHIKGMEQVFQKEPLGFQIHLFVLVRGNLRKNRKPYITFLRCLKPVWLLDRAGDSLFYRKFGAKNRTCM